LVEIEVRLKTFFKLNELRRTVEIGCADEEHGVKQEILISMQVTLDSNTVFSGETYKPRYDYCHMLEAVDQAIDSKPRFILQETLFFAIAQRVLSHPLIPEMELSLLKTQRYSGCQSLGISATLTKADIQKLEERYADKPNGS